MMIEKYFKALADKKPRIAKALREQLNIVDIAHFISAFENSDEAMALYLLLNDDDRAEALSYFPQSLARQTIETLSEAELKTVISKMFLDDTTDLAQELPARLVQKLLKSASPSDRNTINKLMNYREDEAGSIMTTEYMALASSDTVVEAVEKIRTQGDEKVTVSTSYVTDNESKLKGIMPLKTLLFAKNSQAVEDVMDESFVFGHTHDSLASIAQLIRKYDINALPILDHDEKLVGVVTVDDVIDVITDEARESQELMAAIVPTDTDRGYFETGVFRHVSKRILWLFILMLSGILAGVIITLFENAIAAIPALVAAIPMLNGTGGNSGAQSSTLVIRGIATEEIRPKLWLRVWWNEIKISAILGLGLAVFNVLRYGIIDGEWLLGIVVAVSLYLIVLLANSLGAMLPIVAKKLKLDPAVMSAPLVTTIVDMASMAIYFGMATLILGI